MADALATFLSSGPVMHLALPDHIMPETVSSVSVLDWGAGGREVGFDLGRVEWQNDAYELVDTQRDADGISVEVYHRFEDPGGWILQWLLPYGRLRTWVDEDEGVDVVSEVIASVRCARPEDSLTPVLLLSGRVRSGAALMPGYVEELIWSLDEQAAEDFFGGKVDSSITSVSVSRPTSIAVGNRRRVAHTDGAILMSGGVGGVAYAVSVVGDDESTGDELLMALSAVDNRGGD